MLSLSTSWNSARHSTARGMVGEIKSAGFECIELGFALPLAIVNEMAVLGDEGLIKVSSLHNMCPIPPDIDVGQASPDYYSLASMDEAERSLAIDAAKNTISYAKRLGAGAVILHTGSIPVKDRTKALVSAFGDKAIYEALKRDILEERKTHEDGYLDNVVRSLKKVIPFASSCGVRVGIETRCRLRDIPLIDEFESIFAAVPDAWYWHDVGHAETFERLGMLRHEDFLERFSGRLLGIHLHDIIGLLEDHKAPLCGTFDFKRVKPYVSSDTIKVIEAHGPATADEVKRGADFLERLFR